MNEHSRIPPEPYEPAHPPRERQRTSISEVISHVTNVVRKEIELARAELNEKVSQAGRAIALLAVAAIVALVALNVLAAALVGALAAAGLGAGWAALIVGGVLVIIALILVIKGAHDLKPENLAPTRTQQSAHRVAEAVKEKL